MNTVYVKVKGDEMSDPQDLLRLRPVLERSTLLRNGKRTLQYRSEDSDDEDEDDLSFNDDDDDEEEEDSRRRMRRRTSATSRSSRSTARRRASNGSSSTCPPVHPHPMREPDDKSHCFGAFPSPSPPASRVSRGAGLIECSVLVGSSCPPRYEEACAGCAQESPS